jgi:prefoldin alpha subunit
MSTELGKGIAIENLSLEQLGYIGKQIEQEISSYSSYGTTLKVAYNKFQDNKEYVKDLINCQDRELLVPITSSLYIPGRCSNIKNVMIEIGTNYFVETKIDKAEKFCERKLTIIKENLEKIDEIMKTKTSHMNLINHGIIAKQQEATINKNKL